MMEPPAALTWLGIALCVIQSACFSGLNLSLFGISALNLEAQAAAGDADARRLLALRRDPNFLLTTVLWGNVGTNVLLTLLANSVLAGALGFVASTFVITFGGEIVPQAYFSRHALRMATLMRPFLRFWQRALYPIAKPSALLLDAWLGGESVDFLGESELREVIKRHVAAPTTEIGRVEGIGALNFMALDDLSVLEEGQELDPKSLIELPSEAGRPIFPSFAHAPDDPFLRSVEASGRKWGRGDFAQRRASSRPRCRRLPARGPAGRRAGRDRRLLPPPHRGPGPHDPAGRGPAPPACRPPARGGRRGRRGSDPGLGRGAQDHHRRGSPREAAARHCEAGSGPQPGSIAQVAGLLGDARVGLAAHGIEPTALDLGRLGVDGLLTEPRVEHLARPAFHRRLAHVLGAAQMHGHVAGPGGQVDRLEVEPGCTHGAGHTNARWEPGTHAQLARSRRPRRSPRCRR